MRKEIYVANAVCGSLVKILRTERPDFDGMDFSLNCLSKGYMWLVCNVASTFLAVFYRFSILFIIFTTFYIVYLLRDIDSKF